MCRDEKGAREFAEAFLVSADPVSLESRKERAEKNKVRNGFNEERCLYSGACSVMAAFLSDE